MIESTFKIDNETSGSRIDVFLAKQNKELLSRSKIKKLIIGGNVTVCGKVVRPHYILKEHDQVSLSYAIDDNDSVIAQDIPLHIVYEDEELLVINKPAGLVVHPAAGNRDLTLVNALKYYLRDSLSHLWGEGRAGIVHRLDKNTSGVMVVAKNDVVHAQLSDMFKNHEVTKVYTVIVKGIVQHDQGKCDVPIGRGRIFRRKMVVRASNGKMALTEYRVIKRFTNATVLDVTIHTGRTHQIRVHMAHLGYYVLGDKTYGRVTHMIGRQCLHARLLEFCHPSTGRKMTFETPLPSDMKHVLELLESSK